MTARAPEARLNRVRQIRDERLALRPVAISPRCFPRCKLEVPPDQLHVVVHHVPFHVFVVARHVHGGADGAGSRPRALWRNASGRRSSSTALISSRNFPSMPSAPVCAAQIEIDAFALCGSFRRLPVAWSARSARSIQRCLHGDRSRVFRVCPWSSVSLTDSSALADPGYSMRRSAAPLRLVALRAALPNTDPSICFTFQIELLYLYQPGTNTPTLECKRPRSGTKPFIRLSARTSRKFCRRNINGSACRSPCPMLPCTRSRASQTTTSASPPNTSSLLPPLASSRRPRVWLHDKTKSIDASRLPAPPQRPEVFQQ